MPTATLCSGKFGTSYHLSVDLLNHPNFRLQGLVSKYTGDLGNGKSMKQDEGQAPDFSNLGVTLGHCKFIPSFVPYALLCDVFL